MLIGEYAHTLDPKGRIIFPAKLRDDLGEHFVIAKGLDGCLCVYPMQEWQRLEEAIKQLPTSKSRTLQRFFFSGASDACSDKQGRVLVPANLREYASLDKDIMIIGASVRVELWDKQKWDEQCAQLTSENIEEAMDKLGF